MALCIIKRTSCAKKRKCTLLFRDKCEIITIVDKRGKTMGVEIERKFLVRELPQDLSKYPCHVIEQGYLNVDPAIRVRRENDDYYMTYKGSKDLQAEGQSAISHDIGKIEYNLPLDRDSYEHLVAKADGNMIRKKRYMIPINSDAFEKEALLKMPELEKMMGEGSIKIELDVFEAPFEGRILAEVEFPSEEAARAYKMADWFSDDVTGDHRYSNSQMSREMVKDK